MGLIEKEITFWIGNTCVTVFGILAVILNFLEVWLILHKGNKKTSFEITLLSLSFADMISGGLIYFAIGILSLFYSDDRYKTVKIYFYAVCSVGVASSFLHIALITLNRMIAVYFPVKLRIWVTKKRTKFALLAIWFMAFGTGSSMLHILKTPHLYKMTSIYPPVIIMLISLCLPIVYTLIVWKIIRALHQRKQRISMPESQELRNTTSNIMNERLILINSAIVTLCFMLCNMPFAVYLLFNTRKFDLIFTCIMALNPILDPVVYFLSSYFIGKREKPVEDTLPNNTEMHRR